MHHAHAASPRTVHACGAPALSVLRGSGKNNRGVRIRVLREQARGTHGAVAGLFLLLDAGDNVHAAALRPLVNTVTDGPAVLRVIRHNGSACVSVVNTNLLTSEPPEART